MTRISVFYSLRYFTIFILLLFLREGNASKSHKFLDFETTRLKSTGGAGVASLLMDEATLLNPASLAFFQNGSFYFQKSNGEGGDPSSLHESEQLYFIASDAKGKLNGSISYIEQKNFENERNRLSMAMAYPTGQRSSLGVSYWNTKEILKNSHSHRYKQIVLGVGHALNRHFTIGMVVIDPLEERPEETRALIGFQYVYQDFISLMLDMGADYNGPLNKTALLKTAIQIKLLDDLYLRTGIFSDKGKRQKGTGVGLGWIQPRLMVDLALKNTNLLTDTVSTNFQQEAVQIRETSFSLSYRF